MILSRVKLPQSLGRSEASSVAANRRLEPLAASNVNVVHAIMQSQRNRIGRGGIGLNAI